MRARVRAALRVHSHPRDGQQCETTRCTCAENCSGHQAGTRMSGMCGLRCNRRSIAAPTAALRSNPEERSLSHRIPIVQSDPHTRGARPSDALPRFTRLLAQPSADETSRSWNCRRRQALATTISGESSRWSDDSQRRRASCALRCYVLIRKLGHIRRTPRCRPSAVFQRCTRCLGHGGNAISTCTS